VLACWTGAVGPRQLRQKQRQPLGFLNVRQHTSAPPSFQNHAPGAWSREMSAWECKRCCGIHE
jgi:hypothetical protein